jgi:hypothetical protein
MKLYKSLLIYVEQGSGGVALILFCCNFLQVVQEIGGGKEIVG